MRESTHSTDSQFDDFAFEYDSALDQGLSVSGENKSYFSQGRIGWLRNCLQQLQIQPRSLLDFGCGIGSAVPDFFDILGIVSLLGVDTSLKSVEIARQKFTGRATFEAIGRFQPKEQFDIAFCNGVFHHIPLRSRATAVDFVHRALRPGGLFAFWENNPWNPGTRYIMSRIPFDRGAVTLTTHDARQILQAGGFEILRTDFLFVFPRVLKYFRWIEPKICKFPLGAQYQILCRKL